MPPELTYITEQEKNPVPTEPAPSVSRFSFSRAQVVSGMFVLLLLFAVTISAALSWAESEITASNDKQVAAAAETDDSDAFKSISLQARGAYVIDLTTQKTLFALNEDAQLPLASITKVPLVLVAAEVLDGATRITISREAVERGEGGGLGTGDVWRAEDLMDFTLLASSNAGAEALAEAANAPLYRKYPTGLEQATVWRMNALAKELGLTHTYFLNPSGLDVSPTQASAFSSARETALLIAYAAKVAPELFAVTTEKETMLGPLNGLQGRVKNTNDALPAIPGLIIGKTGFTDLAGGNLTIVFEVEPMHPIAIAVLGSTFDGRFTDMQKLVAAVQKTITGQNRQ